MAQPLLTRRPGLSPRDLVAAHPPIEAQKGQAIGGDPDLRSSLGRDFQEAQAGIKYMSLDFDDFEDLLFMSDIDDPYQVSEGSLSTLVIERAARVVGQLPSGTVHALSMQDKGKSLLMNLILQSYVYPNANEQYDFKTKLFLWDQLSNTYGSMAMVYDWVNRDDYCGPDCWLVPIRNFFPQQGRFSIQNSDYVFISTFTSFQNLRDIVADNVPNWDIQAIRKILEKQGRAGEKAALPAARNNWLRTNVMFRWRRRSTWTNTGDVELVTKYEKGRGGRWITFAPDFDNIVVRNIENPHQTKKIPVVVKYSLPTLDSIIGLGDMERGRRIQWAIDANLNLQLDKQRINTYPPLMYPSSGVTFSTLNLEAGAKWQVDEPGSATAPRFVTLPNSDGSQNQTYNQLKGAMTNVNGDSQTPVDAEIASAKGKTPAAIAAQQQSQNTRDAMDRWMMESAMQELIEGFVGLINSQQTDPIDLYLFAPEIKQIIQQGYDDVKDMVKFPGKNSQSTIDDFGQAKIAQVTIQPKRVYNQKGYKFIIDPGSTQAADQQKEHEAIGERITSYLSNQALLDQKMAQQGKFYDLAADWKKWVISSGTKDWEDVVKDLPPQPTGQPALDQNGQPIAAPGGPAPAGAMALPAAGGVQPASVAAAAGAPPAGLAAHIGPVPPHAMIGTDSDIASAIAHVRSHVATAQ